MDWLDRSRRLIGDEAVEALENSRVIVFGIGGVGSFVAEGLVRAGIGDITLVDKDVVSLTNINRQLIADTQTLDMPKTKVMMERALRINPDIKVKCVDEFVLSENISKVLSQRFDYAIDAVDTVTAKLAIIERCRELEIPVISCMGTGNKLHPELLRITDISKTSVCPLARVMRYELKKRNISKVKVCFSTEIPRKQFGEENERGLAPASISFVPSVAGLMIAGEVVRELAKVD